MTLADNQAGPERRYSWPRSILIGLVATIGWRFGWGNARWRSTRSRD